MSKALPAQVRAKWDALLAEKALTLGLVNCTPFLENKYVNDIFYHGMCRGVPCVVKCSSRAVSSIRNEWEMSRRLAAVDARVVAEPLAFWCAHDDSCAFVVTHRLPGPSLTDILCHTVSGTMAVRIFEDFIRIAEALEKADVVWRDVIPDNFLMDDSGHLRLIDAQFSVRRSAFREDAFLRAHAQYRLLVFAYHPVLAGRGWNDVAMMLYFTRYLASTPGVRELRARLEALAARATVRRPVSWYDFVVVGMQLGVASCQAFFRTGKRREAVLARVRRARDFLGFNSNEKGTIV